MPGLQSLSHLNFALKSVGYNLDAASRSERAQETDTLSTLNWLIQNHTSGLPSGTLHEHYHFFSTPLMFISHCRMSLTFNRALFVFSIVCWSSPLYNHLFPLLFHLTPQTGCTTQLLHPDPGYDFFLLAVVKCLLIWEPWTHSNIVGSSKQKTQ